MDTGTLRQKILDLALRGKLVPQDPTDEPASVLLEHIRAGKQQMVKEGKLKAKDIKNDTIIFKGEDNLHYEKFQDGTVKCIEDEIPFDVPEGWAWTRLRNICNMAAGKAKPSAQIASEPFEGCFECYGGNGVRGYVDEYNCDGTFSIVGRQGALCGNINIASGKFYATEHAVVTSLYTGINFFWSNYVLEALQLNKYATGAAQPGLSVANVLEILVAVAPTKEQKRIEDHITTAFKNIEVLIIEKNTLLDTITQCKAKILELAIQGKLVPQNPADEPASVLLERIRAEKEELIKQGKIKRDKNESVIFKGDDNSYYEKYSDGTQICIDEEIPFDIPKSWQWTRLNNLVAKEIKRGKAPKYSEEATDTLVFAQKCNLKAGGINIALAKYLDETTLSKYSEAEFLAVGDIVINSTGTGTLGRVGIIEETLTPIVPDTHITVIRTSQNISSQYIYCVLKDSQPTLEDSGEGSTNQKELSPNILLNFLIPVPPLNEQEQICTKVIEANHGLLRINEMIS